MALKPTDIEQKTFSTSLRGYDLDEVDDFLDEIISTLKELYEKLESRPEGEAPAFTPTESDESAVGRVLVKAQETADEIVAQARADAERIRAEAQTEADEWIGERERRKAEAEAELAQLSQEVGAVRSRLAGLATTVADKLDEMDQAIEEARQSAEEELRQPEPAHSAGSEDQS